MNRIRLLSFATLIAVALTAVAVDDGQPTDLRNVQVQRRGGEPLPLQQLVPAGRFVLIVVDARIGASSRLLSALSSFGVSGEKTVVMALGNEGAARALERHRERLPEATWVYAPTIGSLKLLGTSALPLVYGVDVDGTSAWRASGLAVGNEALALRMLDWVVDPAPRPSAR